MSNDENILDVQCVTCGKSRIPSVECEICHGKAATEPREYTLSEIRSGRAPEDKRYGPGGTVGPKIANVPGSGPIGGGF